MSTMIIHRSGQIRLPLHDRKRDVLHRTITQAQKACRQLLDWVDIDHPRNPTKKLQKSISVIPNWLRPAPEEAIAERKRIIREFGCFAVLKEKIKHPLKLNIRFPRERFLGLALLASVTTPIVLAHSMPTQGAVFELTQTTAAPLLDPNLPTNWVQGPAELKGSKAAVLGAYTYAKEADYVFAANNAQRDELFANGTLVKLEGPYIRLKDVTSPYVLPIVAKFANRLGEQYAQKGCGPLIITGAMRPLDFQKKLPNGSKHSVHPTGMPLDLERVIPKTQPEKYCQSKLVSLLTSIERDERIDATAENYPRHYHVVVVPHVYEAYLARQPKTLDVDVKWLATALYFEADFNESMAGYRAIGWAIRNRVRSSEFPNTILEVVADGAVGRSNGGCQFSFMCDGKAERLETLCAKPHTLMSQFWLGKCDERWEVVVSIAKQILAEPESADPTGGAVLYHATWMSPKPDWVIDMKKGTINTIGSHVFACSLKRGSDACRS